MQLDSGGLTTGIGGIDNMIRGKLGGLISWTKLGIAGAVAGVVAGIGTIAKKGIDAFIDYESAFAGVKKTVDATAEELERLSDGIRQMSKEIPATSVGIAAVAEAAGQLGIETENILGFTRVMIDLGESTNLSATDAATALARLANITQMPQTQFDRLGSVIVDLGNNLATTEAEIVQMGLRLAGAGHQVGMTEAQIMSFAGALSSVGVMADAGGSAFSKLMVQMQLAVETGSEDLLNFARVAGMTGEEFQKAFKDDAASAIIAFIQGLSRAQDEGTTAIKILDDMGISEIRLRDSLLRAAGASDVFTDAIDLGNKAWEENTALTTEAEQRYETTASKIQIIKNNFHDLFLKVGEELSPAMKRFLDYVIDSFPQMEQSISGAFAAIGSAVEWFVNTFDGLVESVSTSAGENEETFLQLQEVATEVFTTIKDTISTVVEFITIIWDKYGEDIMAITTTVFTFMWENVKIAFDIIKNLFDFFAGLFTGDWERMGEALWGIVQNIWDLVINIFDTSAQLIINILMFLGKMIIELIKGMMLNFWENLKKTWADMVEWYSMIFNNLFNFFSSLSGRFSGAGRSMLQSVWDGLIGIWGSISGWISDKVNWIADKLAFWNRASSTMSTGVSGGGGVRAYQTGTPFVPTTGLALLHKGEAVIPAKYNPFTSGNGQLASATTNNFTVNPVINLHVKDVVDLRKQQKEITKIVLAGVYNAQKRMGV